MTLIFALVLPPDALDVFLVKAAEHVVLVAGRDAEPATLSSVSTKHRFRIRRYSPVIAA